MADRLSQLRERVRDLGLGSLTDPEDKRDHIASAARPVKEKSVFHNHPLPIRNQLSTSTCVGKGTTRVKEYYDNRHRGFAIQYSSLDLYHHCKQLDGAPDEDGTYPRLAFNVLRNRGVAKESSWPFTESMRPVPDLAALAREASFQKIRGHARLRNTRDMVQNLLLNGPFTASFPIHDGFYTDKCLTTGIVDIKIPLNGNEGLHLVAVDGYHLPSRMFRIANSWGTEYGDRGYNWIARDWVEAHCQDAWAMTDDETVDAGIKIEVPVLT